MNRRGLDGFSRQSMKKMKNEEGIRYRAGQQTQDQKDFMARNNSPGLGSVWYTKTSR
jgi:hypothetical protein